MPFHIIIIIPPFCTLLPIPQRLEIVSTSPENSRMASRVAYPLILKQRGLFIIVLLVESLSIPHSISCSLSINSNGNHPVDYQIIEIVPGETASTSFTLSVKYDFDLKIYPYNCTLTFRLPALEVQFKVNQWRDISMEFSFPLVITGSSIPLKIDFDVNLERSQISDFELSKTEIKLVTKSQ
ncbi:hypothetical protein HZS_4926 [Henneguya salminicola]|nr:hypothetical protein HZS_4926 [Henneguya salminicola]